MSLNVEILSRAANEARGLCMDAVQASQSGHLGLPLGCAEMGAVLYGYALKHNPDKPRWIGRDYFVLSAGHGSMFLYAWLHLSGYDLPMSEIKRFRQLHSKTPGHPEFLETPGVECTTGPLGQGVGNAVGIAVAAKMAGARFNTTEHRIFDQHVICLAGDGCMQEGVASEASAFAGHFGLDNLILIYDSNAVTLDAPATATQSEDTAARFKAYGFDVQEINGQDMQQFLDALEVAKERNNGRPQFIVAHTLIGKGVPEVAGTYKAHGEAGAKFVDAGRKGLGLPDEHYFVSKVEKLALLIRKHDSALLVSDNVLSLGRKLTHKPSAIFRLQVLVLLNLLSQTRELCGRHDHHKSAFEIRDSKELLYLTPAPARRNGNAILRVHGMPEFSSKNRLRGWGRFHMETMGS